MSKLSPGEPSIAAAGADPGRRKAAAHEARGVQTFAVTSTPAATPIANMVEAMRSGGILVEVVVLPVRTTELARGGYPVVERRRTFDREGERQASAKTPPVESQHAPPFPELHEKSSVVAKLFASKWLHALADNNGVVR